MAAIAFFDFDGTLVSSDVVGQYLWYVRRAMNPWRFVRLAARARTLKRADRQSRELFNHLFYAEYRGWRMPWLREQAPAMFESYLRPRLHRGVFELLDRVRGEGYTTVLVTGGLDFAMEPVKAKLGFTEVLANSLEFDARSGLCSGKLKGRVLAGASKVEAMREVARRYNVELVNCRAYSDDTADLPMLEAVGQPFAASPKADLRAIAVERRWTVLEPPYSGSRGRD